MYIDERQKEVARLLINNVDLMIRCKNDPLMVSESMRATERASDYAAIFQGLRQVYYEYPELKLPKGQKVQ